MVIFARSQLLFTMLLEWNNQTLEKSGVTYSILTVCTLKLGTHFLCIVLIGDYRMKALQIIYVHDYCFYYAKFTEYSSSYEEPSSYS